MAVPKLRFKEFTDSYTSYKLKEIVDFYKGNTLAKSDIKENGNKKCILYGELYTKYSEVAYSIYSNTNNNSNNLFIGLKNDVLIPCSGETALDISTTTCLQEDNVIIGSDVNVLRPKDQDGIYLSYLLCNKKRREIAKYAQGDSIVHLYGEKIKNINVYIPSIKEQNLISSLFSKLDKKIELQSKKIEALKLYKKGLIELLINKIPNNYIPLKNILKERKSYSEKGLEYPHVTLSKDGIYDKGERYNRDFLVKAEDKNYKITIKNDLCYNPANLKFGVICLNEYGSAIFSPIYVTFEIKYYYPQFVKYYLTRNNFINSIRKYEQGTVYERMAVSPNDFLKGKIKNIKIEDQIKISKTIDISDKIIDLETKKYEKLNKLKKGLMQYMFV